jgi:hypothetical protein
VNEDLVNDLAKRFDSLQQDYTVLKRKVHFSCALFASLSIVIVAGGAVLQNVGRFQKAVEVVDVNSILRSVMFAEDSTGKSGLQIRDPSSNVRMELHTNRNNDPHVELFDVNLKKRIEFGVAENGDAYILLLRGNGTVKHSLIAEN